jgi:hypothetical protein
MVAAVEPICAPKVQEECVGERAEYHARFVCILLSSGCGVSYYHFTELTIIRIACGEALRQSES